jgi:hypothetical protein
MKHIQDFSTFKTDVVTEHIIPLIEKYGEDFLTEGKIGDWIILAPKIRRLQERANQLRIRAAREEVKQRKAMERAIEMGKDPKPARLWELLQKKIDALEDNAREYELEAIEISQGNDYLRRVQRVARLRGAIKVNNEKYAIADAEERRELMKNNQSMTQIIKKEEKIIEDKIKIDKERIQNIQDKLKEEKKKESAKKKEEKEKELNPVDMYFKERSANSFRKRVSDEAKKKVVDGLKP